MNNMEEYRQQQVVQAPARLETPVRIESDFSLGLIRPILRRWYIVLVTSVVVCIIGVPVVWYLTKPQYQATAAIRVAPIIPSILFGDKDSERVMPMYQNFKNDQAAVIMRDQRVLQRVADELADKKLRFFEDETALSQKPTDPVQVLRRAISKRIITAAPARNSELILIRMKSRSAKEAEQIVDAFRTAYMAIEGSKSSQGGDQKLQLLENERRVFADKLQRQRENIRQLAEEYGSVLLTPRQEMMLQRVAVLQDLVTKVEADKLLQEIKIEILEKTRDQPIPAGDLLERRHMFIQSDPLVQTLTERVAELQEDFIVATQILSDKNPELKRRTELLEAFKTNLEERRKELAETFDENIAEELNRNRDEQLVNAKAKLEGLIAHKEILQDKLNKEDIATINLGRKQLDIQEQQEQLALTKEVYDTIRRRIQELEMERKRPARISIPYEVTSAAVPNRRIKLTAAVIFAAIASGMLLALLRDRTDLSLHTPDDVVKRIGSRVIGTTTCSDGVKKSLLPQRVADDYQSILANLGLRNGGGIPNKLVVTSAVVRDGKTTFAVNLATSLAKMGKKVLLIDGDLRKPDIRRLLNLPKGSRGLQELLFGKSFESVVDFVPSVGFDVLAADSRNMSDACRLLSLPHLGKCLNIIGPKYDHVIIDTSPVLAFPDALLWAKIADGVILTSFAGHTEEPDLRETLERLAQIKAKVLGTILSCVRASHSYNRYGYSYNANRNAPKAGRRRNNELMLLLPAEET